MFSLRRALNSFVHIHRLQCSRGPPSLSSSLLQRLRPQPQLRFFIPATPKAWGRPYPHRPYQNYQKPPFLDFLDRIPHNTVFWGIIIINGVVFVMWNLTKKRALVGGERGPYQGMFRNFTNSWQNCSEGRIWTLITSTFSHKDVRHVLFNGLTFYFMAKPLLELVGTRKFLLLYMGGGLIGSLVSMGWHNLVKHNDTPSLGASGSIYSVISLFAALAPRTTFMLYFIIPVPAWLAVSGIFMYDTYSAMHDKQRETDHAGHVGGLLSGIACYLALRFKKF